MNRRKQSLKININMKLDRNITNPKRGKYALIKLRDVEIISGHNGADSHITIRPLKAVDFGDADDSDFFVIRLKDKYAAEALHAYANAADKDDPEYGAEVRELALLAQNHPNKRIPD